jgi:phenylpropionate dioxygenase-like ring-hydroxylating dioxygenase large terminal subunit
MSKKVSRRQFARTSVAASAAAVTMPGALLTNGRKGAAPRGDAARQAVQTAAGAASGWREGYTVPAEYYVAEKHYLNDERFLASNLWLMVDHESRIPNTGDYFVFAYGRGESVIILRDRAKTVKAFYNVCRHRGSRLCRQADNPAPADVRLSVKQLGTSGNTPVFRCPYHAWTYDVDGRLIAAYGMPPDFDFAQNGLIPCHLQTAEGFIFVNFSQGQPPDFEAAVTQVRGIGERYGTAKLKVGARIAYPTKANWKLALENFLECYHCGPAHRSLVTTHDWDYSISAETKNRREAEMDRWVPPQVRPRRGGGMGQAAGQQTGQPAGQPSGQPPANPSLVGRGWLLPNHVTGSLDGKPVAPLLPNFKEYTHGFREAVTGWSTAYWAAYDDHVAVARFTPRDVGLTDSEIIWLVHPDAREGKDYQVERLTALWDITMREDKWIVENNHQGVLCGGGYVPGRYATHEVGREGPAQFIKWYMTEVVPAAASPTQI